MGLHRQESPSLHQPPRRVKATFKLEPEYVDVPTSAGGADSGRHSSGMELGLEELTEDQLNQLKESSHKRVKRIIAGVGITLTLISVLLVALSLTLGQKIDELVGEKTRQDSMNQGRGQVGTGANFFLGAPPSPSPSTSSTLVS